MADLRLLRPEPLVNSSAISLLEDALERAKAGDVESVAVALVYRGRETQQAWSHSEECSALIGSVSLLHHKLCNHISEEE